MSDACFSFTVLPPLVFLLVTRASPAVVRPDSLASENRPFLLLEMEPADSDQVKDLIQIYTMVSKTVHGDSYEKQTNSGRDIRTPFDRIIILIFTLSALSAFNLSNAPRPLLTLGVHAQRGLQYFVCAVVRPSVCLSFATTHIGQRAIVTGSVLHTCSVPVTPS